MANSLLAWLTFTNFLANLKMLKGVRPPTPLSTHPCLERVLHVALLKKAWLLIGSSSKVLIKNSSIDVTHTSKCLIAGGLGISVD